MLNTKSHYIFAYTTKEFIKAKHYKKDDLYPYTFDYQDNIYLNNGSIKLFSLNMYDFVVIKDSTIKGKKYIINDTLSREELSDKDLMVLCKSKIVKFNLKDYKNLDILNIAKCYNLDTKTIKSVSEHLGVNADEIKKHLNAKNITKKITDNDIDVVINIMLNNTGE